MVGRPGSYQFSFNAGELAPEVQGNTGLKQYFAGAAQMVNVEPVPQGGFRQMPRSRYRDQVPRVIEPAGGLPACRLLQFGVSKLRAYMVVMTPGLAAIYKGGVKLATVAVPYGAADLQSVKPVQRQDTMLLFHPGFATGRLLNDGTDAGWSYDLAPFVNVPQVQLGGVYTNIDEQWTFEVTYSSGNPVGVGFVVSVDGDETKLVQIDANPAVTAAAIKAAIEELPIISPGITVGAFTAASTYGFEITFTGGQNSGENFVVSGRPVGPQTFYAVQTWRNVIGKRGGEPLFSPTRLYAATGTFYQDRLAMGGFAAKTSAFALSRTGEYYDFETDLTGVASGALLLNLDTDGPESIVDMVQSKHLVIFTTEADYYVSDRAIAATAAPAVVQSSTNGCSYRVPVIKQEAGLIYVNRDETIVLAATFDAVSDAYVSEPLSLLSSHLVFGMRDAALQRAATATDSQRYWLVRDDGVMVPGLLIRNQDVTAFVRWVTDGQVRAVGVDGANVTHILVDRAIGGQTILCLETLEDGLVLDCAVTFTLPAPIDAVGGLVAFEGATVYAIADGYVEGPFTVTGGFIHLQYPATTITVGRWTPPLVETLPLVRDVAPHTVLKRPARVFQVAVDLIATTSFAIGANGRPARDVALSVGPVPTDAPLPPYTGQKTVSGLTGWSDDGRVTLTQTRPGALQVRNITVEAKI